MPGPGLGGGYARTNRRKTGGVFAHSPVIGRDRPAAGGRWLRTCGPQQDDHTNATIADSPVRLSTKDEPIPCIDDETYSP